MMVCISCKVRAQCKDYSLRIGAKEGMWAAEMKKRK